MLPNYVNSFIKLASNLIFYTIITAEKWRLQHHSKSRSMLSNKTMSDLFRNGQWIVRRISNIVWPLWYRRFYDTNIEFKVLNSNVTWANLSCFWFFWTIKKMQYHSIFKSHCHDSRVVGCLSLQFLLFLAVVRLLLLKFVYSDMINLRRSHDFVFMSSDIISFHPHLSRLTPSALYPLFHGKPQKCLSLLRPNKTENFMCSSWLKSYWIVYNRLHARKQSERKRKKI